MFQQTILKSPGEISLRIKPFRLLISSGLAIGLACFILIALYVLDEISYDRFHEKSDQHLSRSFAQIRMGGSDLNLAVASDPMGATLNKIIRRWNNM